MAWSMSFINIFENMADYYHNSSMSFEKSMPGVKVSQLQKVFTRFLEIAFFALLVLTPLIHGNLATEYFEFPKMFIVYFAGSLIALVYLLGLIWKVFPFKTPPIFITLFFLTQVTSALLSDFPYTAFWGYYPRLNGGLVSSLIYFGLFTVAFSVFDFRTILKFIFFGLVLSSIPISILGILQYLGLTGTQITRVYSTIGQPNWLAIYLVWVLLLIFHRFLKDSKDKLLLIWLAIFVLVFVCFWLTFSLSGWLALLAGVLALFWLNKSQYFFKRLPILLLPALLLTLFFPGMIFSRIQDGLVDFLKLFSGWFVVLAQTNTYQVSDPGFIRLALWEGTLHLIFSSLRYFLIGTGPETFSYIFPFFRPLALNFSSEWDFIINKPHNYYLELLAETGVFSLILHLFILSKAFLRKHPWGTALFIAFAVSNFFGWPSVVVSLYFWFLLAGILQYEK